MKATVIFFAFLFFLHFANPAFAAAPTITVYPTTTINLDTSFTITATMSGLSNNAIYRLRVAMSQSGTSNYFGSTYDGTTWHMGSISDGNFVSITTDGNGAWGGDIQGKIDSDDPNFTTGSGTYDLKIGRYTQTGNSPTWSSSVSVTITVPPTPTPTATPTPTSTPTPTPAPTSTSTPTPTPTKTPTPAPIPNTPTLTSKPSATPTQKLLPTSVLGNSTESGEKLLAIGGGSFNEAESISSEPKNSGSNWFQKILMFVGVVFIAACAILAFRAFKKEESMQNEEE